MVAFRLAAPYLTPMAEHDLDLGAAPGKALTPEAHRALEEAAARRAAAAPQALPPEEGGRDGPDPTRFGDWEKKGLAVDFS
jgi:hypothetical protein